MKYPVKVRSIIIIIVGVRLLLSSCAGNNVKDDPDLASHDHTKEIYSIHNSVKENKIIPDSIIRALNAQHHHLNVLERRTVPGPFNVPGTKYYADHVVKVEDLPVINPGPGEYVHVMEGQRHGYKNLTIAITEIYSML